MARPTSLPWMDRRQTDAPTSSTALANQPRPGGTVIPFLAALTLNVGDAVHITAAGNTVTKTNVAADGVKFAGIVVGGFRTGGEILDDRYNQSTVLGTQAALVGEEVLVQVDGIATVLAGAAIAPAVRVGLDTTTAGRVLTNVTAGQIIGTSVSDAAGAASELKILIDHR